MRLRLAAALTRLDAAGTIHVRRDTTVGQVARSLALAAFRRGRRALRRGRLRPPAARRPTMRPSCASVSTATVDEAVQQVSGGRRLIVIGVIVLAVLVALRALGELTRDDQRAQGPAGSSYAYGPYGASAYASAAAALGARRPPPARSAATISTSTRG